MPASNRVCRQTTGSTGPATGGLGKSHKQHNKTIVYSRGGISGKNCFFTKPKYKVMQLPFPSKTQSLVHRQATPPKNKEEKQEQGRKGHFPGPAGSRGGCGRSAKRGCTCSAGRQPSLLASLRPLIVTTGLGPPVLAQLAVVSTWVLPKMTPSQRRPPSPLAWMSAMYWNRSSAGIGTACRNNHHRRLNVETTVSQSAGVSCVRVHGSSKDHRTSRRPQHHASRGKQKKKPGEAQWLAFPCVQQLSSCEDSLPSFSHRFFSPSPDKPLILPPGSAMQTPDVTRPVSIPNTHRALEESSRRARGSIGGDLKPHNRSVPHTV